MSAPNKVLFIAYHFPPKGGPAVQRSTKFVKELSKNGFLPVVLTIDRQSIERAKGTTDETLLDEIPADVPIHRVPSAIPFKTTAFLRKIRLYRLVWFFAYPFFWENSARWPFKTYKKAKQLILENDIKIVYTSSGPFSAMLLGYKLKKKLKIKWVADLRDPFTDAYAWQFPSKFHWLICRSFERFYIKKTDLLIVNTPEVEKLYLKRGLIAKDKITVITNGF